MSAHSEAHRDKVKVTFECTEDERAYIKMLAAKAHLTLNDFLLSCLRVYFPKTPNKETLAAMQEIEEGHGIDCDSLDDFWQQMGVKPSAKT